jgi:glycosyltransferase involved in cell wall biosynthesis
MSPRIALISEHASPLSALGGVDSGGQNVYVAQVARQLARRGYAVDVFTRRDDASLACIVHYAPNLRVIHVDAGPATFIPKEEMLPWMPAFASWMKSFIRLQGGYDLAHANFFMSGMVAQQLQRDLGLPFVITFHALGKVRRIHQADADRFPAERADIERRLMEDAAAIIAECPQDKADQCSLYGADPSKTYVIPCGFDRNELWPVPREEARSALGLDRQEKIVVHIGRMVPRKGVDNVIRGFALLVRKHGIAAKLLIVGGESDEPDPERTPEIGRLREIAREEDITERVIFAGRRGRSQLRYYYSAADVFVTTPWYEPFGITPVEAMACGTPVIGSDVGGIKYTVQHCRTGFLIPPRAPEALGNRLAMIFRRPSLRMRMSDAAVQRANRHFTWPQVAAQIADVYEQVLDRPFASPLEVPVSNPAQVVSW